MKLARVVGNVVSTVKAPSHMNKKLMIVEYLDLEMKPRGPRVIAFDAADAGIGDIVLVAIDGGAAKLLQQDKAVIADCTICGVVDHFTADGKTTVTTGKKRA